MPDPSPLRVVVVGAGIAGLVAACELEAAGVTVTLLDKGRSVGGRLATRRIGNARLDHGAQFFTVRTPAFQRRVDDWIDRGLVEVWCHGFGHGSLDTSGDDIDSTSASDGYPRYVATGGMNSLAKDLANGLDVEVSTMVFTVRPGTDARWDVVIDDGTTRPADAVVITAPLPQAFSLLVDLAWTPEAPDPDTGTGSSTVPDHGVELDESVFRVDYDRTIGLLCTVDGPTAVPEPGGVQHPDAPGEGARVFSFIGDNQRKGVSDAPALTFHASPAWSEAHWDADLDDLKVQLTEAAQPWLGSAKIVEAQVKKWRLATPRSIWPDPCWSTANGSIIVAGDAFAGPRVEGAHNSGLAAAHELLG